MKELNVIFLIFVFIAISFQCKSQTDSVLFYSKDGLESKYQVISFEGDVGIQKHFTYFKYKYRYGKVDTVNKADFIKTETGYKQKESKRAYMKLSNCDSIINLIKNRTSYDLMKHEIYELSIPKIGSHNEDFKNYRLDNRIQDFHLKCNSDYNKEEQILRHKLLEKIDSIELTKKQKFDYCKLNYLSLEIENIKSFITSFDECYYDYKTLEIIIINRSGELVEAINTLEEVDFQRLLFKLDSFPKESRIDKMIESLIKIDVSGNRKRKITNQIKNNKG